MNDDERNEIAEAIYGLSRAIDRLGNGNVDGMGAVEALGVAIGGAIERGLSDIADAIRQGGTA